MYLIKDYFYQAINKKEHFKEMEKRRGKVIGRQFFVARHLILFQYWLMVIYYFCSPTNAYGTNIKIDEYPFNIYTKYQKEHPKDQKIKEMAQHELIHVEELI